jgi:hypothetical protein
MTLGACNVKYYGFVIYGKWTNFVVFLLSSGLDKHTILIKQTH